MEHADIDCGGGVFVHPGESCPTPPPAPPTIRFDGPAEVYACYPNTWSVYTTDVDSGYWMDGEGDTSSGHSLNVYFYDSWDDYNITIYYTALGPGGTVTEPKTILVHPYPYSDDLYCGA